jgi:hypothetical protein
MPCPSLPRPSSRASLGPSLYILCMAPLLHLHDMPVHLHKRYVSRTTPLPCHPYILSFPAVLYVLGTSGTARTFLNSRRTHPSPNLVRLAHFGRAHADALQPESKFKTVNFVARRPNPPSASTHCPAPIPPVSAQSRYKKFHAPVSRAAATLNPPQPHNP